MKKIISLLIITVMLLSLFSCGDEYPPVKSTDEEAKTVMTIKYENKSYDVKYELYRALFLEHKSSIDNGDDSVWTGDNKGEYISEIDELILERITDIYAIFHIAEKIGIDVHSKKYDDMVKDYVRLSVNPSHVGGEEVLGFGGDYDKFLEHLKSMNLNYSVMDLLIRYSLASEDIYLYYAGNLGEEDFVEDTIEGALKYTREDVKEFYYSSDSVRVLRAFISSRNYASDSVALDKAEIIREKIIQASNKGDESVANYIAGTSTIVGGTDVKKGLIITRHNLDSLYYAEYKDEAFKLEPFGVSPVIKLKTGREDGYAILYRAVKTSEHFESAYNDIAKDYVQHSVGKIIDTGADEMLKSITFSDYLNKLDRASISMN